MSYSSLGYLTFLVTLLDVIEMESQYTVFPVNQSNSCTFKAEKLFFNYHMSTQFKRQKSAYRHGKTSHSDIKCKKSLQEVPFVVNAEEMAP